MLKKEAVGKKVDFWHAWSHKSRKGLGVSHVVSGQANEQRAVSKALASDGRGMSPGRVTV